MEDNDILDNQSNSGLSAQAKSLFDGMDGIELGDVEIGGMGSGLTDQDQDVQGDQGDSIKGQGDSVDGQSNSIQSGGGFQDTGTSPRRTRSGKVVKYRDE